MPLARFCTNRRCKRLSFGVRNKGRCQSCGKVTLKLKFPSQVEAAESNRLLWFGHKLIIKSSNRP